MKYREFIFDAGKGYVRNDKIKKMRNVDVIIFDCGDLIAIGASATLS